MSRTVVTFVAILLLAPGAESRACGEIGVISRDGRFLVLDGDSLAVRDLGNLWWLGFLTIDYVIPGSTLGSAVLGVEVVIEPASGRRREDEYGRLGGNFVLRNLERGYTPPSGIPGRVRRSDELGMTWVRDGEARYLVTRVVEGEKTAIMLLDDSFKVLGKWTAPEATIGAGAACIDAKGRVILGGLDHRVVIDQDDFVLEGLERADRSDGYRLSNLSLGCKAIMGRANPVDASLRDVALIDLAKNVILSEYQTPVSQSLTVMFAEGTRILRQVMIAIPVPGTVGVRREPTGTFRVIDTANGNVIRERTLDIVPGEIHQQLLCRGAAERVVIQSPNAVHLLDVNTLEILATQQVPFERYFILGD